MDPQELAMEEARLKLEERRVAAEERTARHGFWTRLVVVIPLVAALIAFGASVLVQRLNARDALALQEHKADDDFELKAADILMAGKGPYEVRGRSVALRQLFPERLGPEFALDFDPNQVSDLKAFFRDQQIASKKELLMLVAEHPEERRQIIATWRRLFPGDTWINQMK